MHYRAFGVAAPWIQCNKTLKFSTTPTMLNRRVIAKGRQAFAFMIVHPAFKTLLSALVALCVTGSALVYAQSCTTLRVNGSDGWEPIAYRENSTGELHGLGLDVLRQVAARLNVAVHVQNSVPWPRLFHLLDVGGLDVLLGVYHTEDRAAKYTYTSAFFQEEIRVFVHKERSFAYARLQDLIGKRGMRPLGGSYGTEFDQFDEQYLTIEQYSDAKKSFGLLAAGRIQYILLANYDGLRTAEKLGFHQEITPLPTPVTELPVYFLLSRASPCVHLLDDINRRLADLIASGQIAPLLVKYGLQ